MDHYFNKGLTINPMRQTSCARASVLARRLSRYEFTNLKEMSDHNIGKVMVLDWTLAHTPVAQYHLIK